MGNRGPESPLSGKERKARNSFIPSTKGCHPNPEITWLIRRGEIYFAYKFIFKSMEKGGKEESSNFMRGRELSITRGRGSATA